MNLNQTTSLEDINFTDYKALIASLWKQPEDQVDFKEPFRLDTATKKVVCGLVKDILAMANREGGGVIIIGKKDSAGLAIDCSDEVIKSFDATKVHDKVKGYGRPEPSFNIHWEFSPEGTRAIIITVKEFVETPVICCQTVHLPEDRSPILREGAVFIRSTIGNAKTSEISTEQDMRNLINRALLKSRSKLTSAFDDFTTRYLQSGLENRIGRNEEIQKWQQEEKKLLKKFESFPPLSEHRLQLIAYPQMYEEDLFDKKSLIGKLVQSISMHRGWSFPCPNFEIQNDPNLVEDECFLHSSSRRFMEGEMRSIFGVTTSGLLAYQEELTTAYDTIREGKPLLILWNFLTVYRAVKFCGAFYDFLPKSSTISIKLLIKDAFERIPCREITHTLCRPVSFYDATTVLSPKLSFQVDVSRDELSNYPIEATLKIARKMLEATDASPTEDELREEIGKIAKAS